MPPPLLLGGLLAEQLNERIMISRCVLLPVPAAGHAHERCTCPRSSNINSAVIFPTAALAAPRPGLVWKLLLGRQRSEAAVCDVVSEGANTRTPLARFSYCRHDLDGGARGQAYKLINICLG